MKIIRKIKNMSLFDKVWYLSFFILWTVPIILTLCGMDKVYRLKWYMFGDIFIVGLAVGHIITMLDKHKD